MKESDDKCLNLTTLKYGPNQEVNRFSLSVGQLCDFDLPVVSEGQSWLSDDQNLPIVVILIGQLCALLARCQYNLLRLRWIPEDSDPFEPCLRLIPFATNNLVVECLSRERKFAINVFSRLVIETLAVVQIYASFSRSAIVEEDV